MELFQEANKAFIEHRYELAIQKYNKLLDDDYKNLEVLYNLGSAYFQKGDIANAIYFLEKANILYPNNPNIDKALSIISSENKIQLEPTSQAFKLFTNLSINFYAILFTLTLTAIFIFVGLTFFLPLKKVTMLSVMSIATFFIFISAIGGYYTHQKLKEVIISSADARILGAPYSKAELVKKVESGEIFFLDKEHGKFCRIESLDKDLSGWISKDSVKKVISD
jgi:tetratricopeptide (TPR) repeat protein